jgi:hypothetical protein
VNVSVYNPTNLYPVKFFKKDSEANLTGAMNPTNPIDPLRDLRVLRGEKKETKERSCSKGE